MYVKCTEIMFSAKWTIYDNEKPKGTKWKKYNIVSLMKHSTTTTTMTIQDIYRIRPQWKWWRALALSSRPPKIPPVEKKKPSRRFFFRHKTTSIIINSWPNGGQLNNSKNGRLYWAHTDTNSVQNVPFWLLFVYVDFYQNKQFYRVKDRIFKILLLWHNNFQYFG